MKVVKSRNGVSIRLTEERASHIYRRHPEMSEEAYKINETVENPDFIQVGDSETLMAIKFYRYTSLTSKYLVVVYRELNHDGFVLTAYFTNSPSEKRRVAWKP